MHRIFIVFLLIASSSFGQEIKFKGGDQVSAIIPKACIKEGLYRQVDEQLLFISAYGGGMIERWYVFQCERTKKYIAFVEEDEKGVVRYSLASDFKKHILPRLDWHDVHKGQKVDLNLEDVAKK